MKTTKLQTLKNKTKRQLPALTVGVVVGGVAAAYLYHRMYNPKDKVAMQLPASALRILTEEGKALVFQDRRGWYTLKFEPHQ